MNGFQKHAIDHSSPSQINMWADAPCAWIAKYLFDKKFSFSNAARAGVLVENAVKFILTGKSTQEEAIEQAYNAYMMQVALTGTEADRNRGQAIRGMIEGAIDALKEYGEPEFTETGEQKKVEIVCKGDGWELPVIGFLDFHFPKHGVIVDLKTTMRMPSSMSSSHLRQQAVYQKVIGNQEVKFLYVTGKKAEMFSCEGHDGVLAEIKVIMNRQERFLRIGDKETLKSIVPVNQSSFYWSGDEVIRQELYGI